MSGHIHKPENPDEAITMLPASQNPYSEECSLSRLFQSVLFHYGIRSDEVDILVENEINTVAEVRLANPDGDQDARDLFEDAVCKLIRLPLRRLLMKKAFRRMLLAEPLAPLSATPLKDPASTSEAKSLGPKVARGSEVVVGRIFIYLYSQWTKHS